MSFFGFEFHLYGFFVGLGFLVTLQLAEYLSRREKFELPVNFLAGWTIAMGLIGARIYHLVTDWSLYGEASFFELIAIWNGGLGIWGGLIGGILGLGIALHVKKQRPAFWKITDLLAISVPFGQAIGRWGNYFNQELYGQMTNLPWGISIEGLPGKYHPLFFYESLGTASIGAVLLSAYFKKRWNVGERKFFGTYLVLYALLRFWLEFLRIDSARIDGLGISLFSVAQWVCLLAGSYGIFLVCKK